MSKSANASEADRNDRRQRASDRNAGSIATDVSVVKAALDRIVIPQDAIDRISEVVSPGSALIVSDEAMSKGNREGHGFRGPNGGEPQAG